MFKAIFEGASRLPAVILAVAGAACLWVATEHFAHEHQPRARDTKIPGYDHIVGPTLAEIPAAEFKRGSGEAPLAYATRMTRLVHFATYHCDPTAHSLSLVEAVVEKVMIRTGRDPQRAHGLIDRNRLRCGYCSERAIVLADILNENGMQASVQGLTGHVTALVVVDGVEYLADPDYGVGPYPYDLPESELRGIYLASSSPKMTDIVVPMVFDRDDDAPYFSQEFADGLKRLRTLLFTGSTVVAGGLASVGIGLLFAAAFLARSRRTILRGAPA